MSRIRVIAGTARGTRLRTVPGDSTRPIMDRVKENLFNILGMDVPNSTWLDMFAGTGSVGIEALSRGATSARFLDNNRNAIQTIRTNLKTTRLTENAEIIQTDALAYLAHPADTAFDYIFIAPPQYKSLWATALRVVDENPGWLSDESWVIAQIDPLEMQAVELENLVEIDQRRYGNTLLLFYEIQ